MVGDAVKTMACEVDAEEFPRERHERVGCLGGLDAHVQCAIREAKFFPSCWWRDGGCQSFADVVE